MLHQFGTAWIRC